MKKAQKQEWWSERLYNDSEVTRWNNKINEMLKQNNNWTVNMVNSLESYWLMGVTYNR